MPTTYRPALLELLRTRRHTRPVFAADITYWISGRLQDGTADPAWATEDGYLRLHNRFDVMPYYYYPEFLAGYPVYDATIRVGSEQKGHASAQTWSTPVGDIRMEQEYVPASCSVACTHYPVQNAADLQVFRYLIEHRHLVSAQGVAHYPERLAAWAAFDGVPSIGLPRSPLPAFCYEWAGLQSAVYLLLDHEAELRETFALMEAQEKPIVDALCDLKPVLVHFPDNLSSETLTGLYDEWLQPTHTRRLAALHAAGVPAAVHLDGTVAGLLPKLAATGFDAVEALTPHPVGDVTVADMRRLCGRLDLILWGGLPGAMFAPPFTWKDMEKHVEQLLAAWDGTPFIVGVADQIPPDGDITFCNRIAAMLT